MVGKNQVGGIADEKVLIHLDAPRPQSVDFGHKGNRVDHDTIPDYANLCLPQDARWNQVEDIFLSADHDRVACIVPALAAYNDVRLLGEKIDDLTFSFVAPLGTG